MPNQQRSFTTDFEKNLDDLPNKKWHAEIPVANTTEVNIFGESLTEFMCLVYVELLAVSRFF
ncbi:hypothetical protein AGMMS49983_12260 [Clostridia bacterium]|nr:hypothetical protein AGMMS49983_12260 [Clostridia bacterium]